MAAITFTDNMKMTLFGDPTPREVIHKHESHKLHQAFNVTDGKTIEQGEMCYLMPDGTITSWGSGAEPAGIYVGIAITDSVNPVYLANRQRGPIEVTVAVRGYIVLWGEASDDIPTAGYVAPTGRSTDVASINTWEPTTGAEKVVAMFPVATGELVQLLVLN